MTTTAVFTQAFFQSLDENGLVDRATAVARAAVRERPDWWVPALFMRLRSGRLWYQPGTAPGGERFDKWPSLVTDLKVGMCTPMIGFGFTEALVATRQEIAMDWARSYRYPMAPYNRERLPQVAQYLSVNQNRRFPALQFMSHLRRTVRERYRDDLPADLLREDASVEDLRAAAWQTRHRREEVDSFSVLAQLPAPVYVTTSQTRLLARALRDAGRAPEVELCRWHEDADWPESVFEREPGYRPTPERPLIYHLLGTFDEPAESLVLTEDDFFDFLIGVTRNQDLVPKVVRRRLSDSALMFVGFGLDEWAFRVLYRSLLRSEGRKRRDENTHVAVQNDPEEGTTIDAGRARTYLKSYLHSANVSPYRGSTEHFIKELQDAWSARR